MLIVSINMIIKIELFRLEMRGYL